jgi:hypothetical protein
MNIKKFGALIGVLVLVMGVLAACSTGDDTENAPLAIYADQVSHHTSQYAKVCTVQTRYIPGDTIVFRAKVTNSATGEVDPDANVVVNMNNGDSITLKYAKHGNDMIYTKAYELPAGTPLGIFDYEIVATDGDRTSTFKPVDVDLTKLTIVAPEEVAAQPGTPLNPAAPAAETEPAA